jgi:hypothetical protein
VADAAAQGTPNGLSVVTVIITVVPSSAGDGVYVKSNGDEPEAGVIVPDPFDVIVTEVALPENVLPVTVTGEMPHVLPLILPSARAGPFGHPHDTEKLDPGVEQPVTVFRTVIIWLPFATFVNVVPA